MPARCRLPDEALDLHAVGPVMLFDDLCPGLGRRGAGQCRKKLWVANRAIEIDKQTADRRRHKGRREGTGERLRHDQRAGIVATVGIQQRALPPKQRPIGRRHAVTAVFTGDDEGIHRANPSPAQFGQIAEHLPHPFAPFVAEGGEVGIPVIEPPPPLHFEAVPFVANQVDRHAH